MLGHASTRMTQHYARVMDRNLKDNMNIVRSKIGVIEINLSYTSHNRL